jgi:hypothetical protein
MRCYIERCGVGLVRRFPGTQALPARLPCKGRLKVK